MRKRTVFIYILVILIAIGASLFYILGNKNNVGKEIIISKESTKDYVLDKYKDGFVTYNGVELIHYDTNMEQKWVVMVDEDEAELYVKGDYVLSYCPENNKIYLVRDGEIEESFATEKDLRVASVNENGYIAALTSDKGYKGQCIVYGKNGKVMAEFSFGERYILGAYLMSDNRTLVMNAIEDNGTGYAGKILYADIKSGEIKAETVSENIYSYLEVYKNKVYASDGDVFFCYDKKGNEKWNYPFDSGEALDIGITGNRITMVVKAENSFDGNEIISFNLNGRMKGQFQSESQVTAFDTSEGYSVAVINGEAIFLNRNGKVLSRMDAENEAEEIKLYKKSDRVLFLSDKAVMRKFSR